VFAPPRPDDPAGTPDVSARDRAVSPSWVAGSAVTGSINALLRRLRSALSLALQQRLTRAEVQLALTYRTQNPAADDLLIIDGPLRDRTHLDRAVGYIRTHHASYLPPEQAATRAPRRTWCRSAASSASCATASATSRSSTAPCARPPCR
jgi:hypothetical protein